MFLLRETKCKTKLPFGISTVEHSLATLPELTDTDRFISDYNSDEERLETHFILIQYDDLHGPTHKVNDTRSEKECNFTITVKMCVQRPPLGPKNSGRCLQVVVVQKFLFSSRKWD